MMRGFHENPSWMPNTMKAPLILACLFLLAPMLPASYRLLDDGPPGFLHFQDVKNDPDDIGDTYLRINAITVVTVFTDKKRKESPHWVRVHSNSLRGNGE